MTVITSSVRTYTWNFRGVRNSVLSGLMSVTSQISDFGTFFFDPPPNSNFVTGVCAHAVTYDLETFAVCRKYLVLAANPNLHG